MFTNIGLPDIERRKRKRNLLLGQPQGSLSERIDTPCAYVNLQLTFSCGLPRNIHIKMISDIKEVAVFWSMKSCSESNFF